MRFTRLRISGFKSFVEPVDFRIEPGLTGIVGPNGCGKSNVMESLRWVMGATSAKAMRAGGMDDVIFSGSGARPARNHAEVTLTVDNKDRTAPAAFNDADELEVSRRIVRGQGSVYRVNGRETRARDVQRLFADASSGANSPALVRQGQINELIAAKPENRRRVLEEAAGVAGLRSRRHEAELKLNAAQANLDRLEDVLAEAERVLDGLKRQSRQAKRYRKVAADVRALEAALAARRIADARAAAEAAAAAFAEAESRVAERTRAAAAAATASSAVAADLDPARRAEAEASAALAHVAAALSAATRDLEDAAREKDRAERETALAEEERGRERALHADADEALARLAAELEALDAKIAASGTEALEAASTQAQTEADAAQAERDRLTTEHAAYDARAKALDDRIARGEAVLARLEAERAKLAEAAPVAGPDAKAFAAARKAGDLAAAALERSRHDLSVAEDAADAALVDERKAADARAEAERVRAAAAAEADALARALADDDAIAEPVADALVVTPGYERATAAALGDDLLASLAADAPARWTGAATSTALPALPTGATPLSDHVTAPDALATRLAQIGVIAEEDGDRLAAALAPGQRLVSVAGALWRWDGFRIEAGAASSAERRLDMHAALDTARTRLDEAAQSSAAAATAWEKVRAIARTAVEARDAARAARPAAETEARDAAAKLAGFERDAERADSARAAASSSLAQIERQLAEETEARDAAQAERATLVQPDAEALAAADVRLGAARITAADARAALEGARREAAERAARREAIDAEVAAWSARKASAERRLAALDARRAELAKRIAELADAPSTAEAKLAALRDEKTSAETKRAALGDAVASAETATRSAEQTLRQAEAALGEAREARAGAEARKAAAAERLAEVEAAAAHAPEPDAHAEPVDPSLSTEELETRLERRTAERDRIGPVNLRADEEAEEREAALAETRAERDDLQAAVNKLRAGVRQLDAEARERLLAAFDVIDGHFRDLFQTLFGGGEAKLALVDDEDPLAAGLDIHVSPPGKRLGSMSLMSGGEQALTATALIFAVFLANPAPVCALDEVDAPLDDANVGRFCDLLDAMRHKAETRFLVITHNPVTMSRVDRLFGVTMAERGVSQLVSVDLARAEEMAAAG